jgi:hypothetical protein
MTTQAYMSTIIKDMEQQNKQQYDKLLEKYHESQQEDYQYRLKLQEDNELRL